LHIQGLRKGSMTLSLNAINHKKHYWQMCGDHSDCRWDRRGTDLFCACRTVEKWKNFELWNTGQPNKALFPENITSEMLSWWIPERCFCLHYTWSWGLSRSLWEPRTKVIGLCSTWAVMFQISVMSKLLNKGSLAAYKWQKLCLTRISKGNWNSLNWLCGNLSAFWFVAFWQKRRKISPKSYKV
jgi:hypothetical protein